MILETYKVVSVVEKSNPGFLFEFPATLRSNFSPPRNGSPLYIDCLSTLLESLGDIAPPAFTICIFAVIVGEKISS